MRRTEGLKDSDTADVPFFPAVGNTGVEEKMPQAGLAVAPDGLRPGGESEVAEVFLSVGRAAAGQPGLAGSDEVDDVCRPAQFVEPGKSGLPRAADLGVPGPVQKAEALLADDIQHVLIMHENLVRVFPDKGKTAGFKILPPPLRKVEKQNSRTDIAIDIQSCGLPFRIDIDRPLEGKSLHVIGI